MRYEGPAADLTTRAAQQINAADSFKMDMTPKIAEEVSVQRAVIKPFWNETTVSAGRLKTVLGFNFLDERR